MNIIILGAGNIGKEIAFQLADHTEYTITIADKDENIISHPGDKLDKHWIHREHIKTDADTKRLIKDKDIVINALPHTENIRIAQLAYKHSVNYFDLSEDVESTEFIKKLALGGELADKDIVFMPQCGLAPGFINILANDMAKEFTEIHDVKMRVGALPLSPSNSLKYNFTWSVDGLINEYINDGKAIENGKIVSVKGMEGLEHISIDGIEYEAFNTSGGAGSMLESLEGKARNVDYKTLRYPGHHSIMTTLLNDLKLKNDRETLKKILTNAIPSTEDDVVIIYASVSGIIDGKFVVRTRSEKIYGQKGLTAIQRTTSAGMCVAIDLHYINKLPQSGFIRQEDISLVDFESNRFSFL